MPLDQEDPGIESYDRTKNEKQRRSYGQGVVIEIKMAHSLVMTVGASAADTWTIGA